MMGGIIAEFLIKLLRCFPLLMSGLVSCALIQPVVTVEVEQASRYQWSFIQRLALLDFASPFDYPGSGSYFAEQARELLTAQSSYQLVSNQQINEFVRLKRLSPSRFQTLSTIRFFADAIKCDAICFGDVTDIALDKNLETSSRRKQVGQESISRKIIDSNGNTRVVTDVRPVYQTFIVRYLDRDLKIKAMARMVNASNGEVLWEDGETYTRRFQGIDDEELGRQGSWESDSALVNFGLKQTAERLFGPLLTYQATRERRLATADGKTDYDRLIQEGNQLARKNQWTLAGQIWLKAYNLNKERPEAVANLGIIRERHGEYEAAINDYQIAGQRLGSPWDQYAPDIRQYRGLTDNQNRPDHFKNNIKR